MEKSEPEEPSFPTIAYKSSSTVYMRNYKPGSEGRVTLGVGSLGWRERVTLGGEPTFSHVNGCKRVNSPSGAKSRHAEHAHAHISVADSESESSPSFAVSRETDLQHQMAWLPETLRKDVQCSLCIKTISNPKSLPCNHSSCCECLRKLAAVRKQQGFTTIECPECKMLWEIPESGSFEACTTSRSQNRLFDLLAAAEDCKKESFEECSSCDVKQMEYRMLTGTSI